MLAAISTTVPLLAAAAAAVLIALLIVIGKVPLRYSLRNLTVRWWTTLMTALAFTLVVALFTVMLAFVNGMYRLTDNSGLAGNVIILSDGATDELFSGMSATDAADVENQPGILRVDGHPLSSKETYLVVNQPIPHTPADEPLRRSLQMRGIVDVERAARVHDLSLYPGGHWFSDAGVELQRDVNGPAAASTRSLIQCVLGEGIARELGRDRAPEELAQAGNLVRLDVGDIFSIGDHECRVVGVMRSAGRTVDSEVWAKQSLIGPMFGKRYITSVVVRTADPAAARQVKAFFIKDYKKAKLQAEVESDYYASLGNTNTQFLYCAMFVTVVMAVGGAFGVMNTMFAAVSQRIKDIGVLRLLGYSRGDILISFVMESLATALVGGMIGCALGSLCHGLSATSIVSSGPGGGKAIALTLTVDAGILTAGIVLALVMGLLGGFIPALNAVRLRALEALR